MFPSKWRKSAKARFVPTLELLEKREVLDAALRFSTQQITVSESQTLDPVTVVVELSESSTQPVEFFCNLIPGSAYEEVDFHAHREHFTIPAGSTSITIPLAHIYEDTENEPAETLSFELIRVDTLMVQEDTTEPTFSDTQEAEEDPPNSINPALVTIIIIDNDAPPLSAPASIGVIAPDRLTGEQERRFIGPVGISLADGTASLSQAVGGVVVNYSGATLTNPVLQLRHYFEGSLPATFSTRLIFNNTTTETNYATTGLDLNQEVRLGMLLETATLPTGRYAYTVEIVADGNVLQTYSGDVNWVNGAGSEFGAGWNLAGVDQLVPLSGGVMLVSSVGTSLWFTEGAIPGSYTSPTRDHSTLVHQADGTFLRTSQEGVITRFDFVGRMQSQADRSGNTTLLGRDASGRITSIADTFGNVTVLTYSQGVLSSITDFQGRVTQIGQTNGNLTTIAGPDPDGAGAQSSPTTNFAYDAQHRLTSHTDPRSKATQIVYDALGKAATVTQADGSAIQIRSSQSMTLPAATTGTASNPAQPLLE